MPSSDFRPTEPARALEQLICFSHLRWNFVTQRPQHLMTRFAAQRNVTFWEEPVFGAKQPHLLLNKCAATGVTIAVPQLPDGTPGNPPGTAATRTFDRAAGTNTSGAFPGQSDGTPSNPRGTAAGRAIDRAAR